MELKYVDSNHADLQKLTKTLDDYFFERFGNDYTEYQQYNGIESIACGIVGYENGEAVACGCWKSRDSITSELKRIYVSPQMRRKGYAEQVIAALEENAAKMGCHQMVLETGMAMKDAIGLYQKLGYQYMPNYDEYADKTDCVCMRKEITDGTMR